MTGRPAAVLFDMGGVLLEPLPEAAAFNEEWGARLVEAIDGGWENGLTEDDIIERLAQLAGVTVEEAAAVAARSHEVARLQPELVDCIVGLRRSGVAVGIVSNNGRVRAHWDRVHNLSYLVDTIVISAEEGIAKPDARPWLIAAERLGVEAARCIAIDDSPANVEAAIAAGMAGIVHVSPADTIASLAV